MVTTRNTGDNNGDQMAQWNVIVMLIVGIHVTFDKRTNSESVPANMSAILQFLIVECYCCYTGLLKLGVSRSVIFITGIQVILSYINNLLFHFVCLVCQLCRWNKDYQNSITTRGLSFRRVNRALVSSGKSFGTRWFYEPHRVLSVIFLPQFHCSYPVARRYYLRYLPLNLLLGLVSAAFRLAATLYWFPTTKTRDKDEFYFVIHL